MSVNASFWRGGTSRGLLLRARDLAQYSIIQRENIIYTALGTGDARQIDGLGGGVSSLSKVAIIGLPKEGLADQKLKGILPGVDWADEGTKNGEGYDIVYRFAQVGVRDAHLDWTATCGNMLSAVAVSSIESILPKSLLHSRSASLPKTPNQPLLFPVTILSASNGMIMRARVPIDPTTFEIWDNKEDLIQIAGVPGEAAGIELEMPLVADDGGLVTGNVKDIIKMNDLEIPCSILTAGLPNIFIAIESLNLPAELITASSSTLTSHPTLLPLLEQVRRAASQQFSIPLSLASPKIVLVACMPSEGYTTSNGETIGANSADILVRAISSGDVHATIPGTTLAAINVGGGIKGSLIQELIGGEEGKEDVVTVRCCHAAGVATSSARFVSNSQGKRGPVSVVLMRTAREIMRGQILFSKRVLD